MDTGHCTFGQLLQLRFTDPDNYNLQRFGMPNVFASAEPRIPNLPLLPPSLLSPLTALEHFGIIMSIDTNICTALKGTDLMTIPAPVTCLSHLVLRHYARQR